MWTDKSGDAAFLKKLVSEGEELKISGIVQPREGVTATALTPGIYYTPDLVTHLIEEAATSDVVKEQLAKPSVNVFTGRTFVDEAENPESSDFDMSKLVSIDEEAIASAFTFDESQLGIDTSALNLNMAGMPPLQLDPSALPTMDVSSLLGSLDLGSGLDISIEDVLSDLDLNNLALLVAHSSESTRKRHGHQHRASAASFVRHQGSGNAGATQPDQPLEGLVGALSGVTCR